MFYKSKTCKLWFKKLAVYTLCALLINQQLFSLSASLRQITIDFNDNQPGHALFDNPLFRVEAHLKNVDQLASPESSGYASEDSEYDGGDTSLTLFESNPEFDPSLDTKKSYHEFGGITKINSSDQGVDFKLKDGPDHYLSLTWFQNQLTIHEAKTRGFQLAINFNGTVVFESGENLGSVILNGQETIISGRTSITDLELTTATLQNDGELYVYGTADLNLTTLKQSETARLMARQMNLEVNHLENAGDIAAGEHLHLIKKAGTYSNTGTIGGQQSAELDFLALKKEDKLGKLVAPEIVLSELQNRPLPTINHAQIFAKKSIVIKSSTVAPFLILNSEITTPHLFTTAIGIYSSGFVANIDRMRVELNPRFPFSLGNLALSGILEFAEPGVDLDSAKAKAKFEALYAPVTTPFEHDHTFKVDIQGSLTAYRMRVFGQHILVNVGTQPLKYDEPGYDHTIGSTAGMIDLRQGDGELDIYAHTFDLQKGHVLAKNGAIRAPNLVHLGRLVRDPGSDMFLPTLKIYSCFFKRYNLDIEGFPEPIFLNPQHPWGNNKATGGFQPLPRLIRNYSGINSLETFFIQGNFLNSGFISASNLTLALTSNSYMLSGTLRANNLSFINNFTLEISTASAKVIAEPCDNIKDSKTKPAIRVNNRANRETDLNLSGQAELYVSGHIANNSHEKIAIINNGSCLHAGSVEQTIKIETLNQEFKFFSCCVTAPIDERRKLIHGVRPLGISYKRSQYEFIDTFNKASPGFGEYTRQNWKTIEGRYYLAFSYDTYVYTNTTPPMQRFFPAQTSIGSDAVFDTPESMEGAVAVAGHALVRLGPNTVAIGTRNPYHMPPQPPVSVLDMSTAFDGIYVTLNPLLDQQLRQKVPFTFFVQDAWFQQPEAQQFYEDMACPLIVHGSDGTFKRHIGPAALIVSPSLLIDFVQKEVSKKLRRGFVYPNQPIDEEFIKQLHRQAAQYYTQYFHQGDPVTERSLSTLFSQTDTSSIHPFMFYELHLDAGQSVPLLKPGLFIPPHLIAEVSSEYGPLSLYFGDFLAIPKYLSMYESLPLTNNPNLQRSIIAAAAHDPAPSEPGAMVPAAERQQSGGLELGDMHIGGQAIFVTDGDVDALGHIQAASIQILSISGNVDLNAEVRRHPTLDGFVETVLSRPFLKAMGNITVAAPQGTVTFTAARLLSETDIIHIGGKDINIRAALAHYYHSAQNSRRQGTTSTVSQLEAEAIVAEAERTLTTAGVETLSRSGDTVLQGGQVLQRGTYNTQTTEIWGKKRKGGLSGAFGGKKTTYNLARTRTAIPDRNATTAGSVRVISRSAPAQISGIVTIPVGQIYDVRSAPGARLYTLYDMHETISRTTSSSMLRTVMQGSQTHTRIPRPVTVQGGGRFRFVPLPLPMGETSDLPALTVETFVRPENNHLSSLVVAKNALPGLEDIVAQYPDQVRITPVSLTHHESHYKVVALSPVLGVSVGIAVACLTHGTGAGLLGVTSASSKFFASAVFSAVAGNLANGAASQAVGDRNGLRNAFSEQAVKGMATSIIGQYIGGQLADGLGVAGKASLENMSHLLGRVAIDTTVQTTLRTVVMQENLNKAFAGALRSAAVQQIGRAVATDIGAARAGGGLGYMPHKLLHGITGAITGAILNPDNIASGAIAGSMGAAVGEVIAEELMPTNDEMKAQINHRIDQEQIIKGRLFTPAEREQAVQAAAVDLQTAAKFDIQLKSRLAVTATMGLMGLDPVIADQVAETAIQHNSFEVLAVMYADAAAKVAEETTETEQSTMTDMEVLSLNHSVEQALHDYENRRWINHIFRRSPVQHTNRYQRFRGSVSNILPNFGIQEYVQKKYQTTDQWRSEVGGYVLSGFTENNFRRNSIWYHTKNAARFLGFKALEAGELIGTICGSNIRRHLRFYGCDPAVAEGLTTFGGDGLNLVVAGRLARTGINVVSGIAQSAKNGGVFPTRKILTYDIRSTAALDGPLIEMIPGSYAQGLGEIFLSIEELSLVESGNLLSGPLPQFGTAARSALVRPKPMRAAASGATGEAAAAGGGAPLSLVGLSTSEQQVAKVLNQQLTHMPEMTGLMTESTLSRVIKDIGLKPGQTYQAGYLRNQTLGWIAEQRGMKVLERAGYQVVESKLPGNRGFDAVGIRRTAAGEIQDIMIVESKFSADGAVKLARYKGGRGGHYQQMSDEWMRSVLDRMKKSTNQELIDLSKQIRVNNTKVSRKLNVLSADGNTTWATDKLPKTEVYKS